ncbi:archaeal ATPase, fused to C-terminal DUF234 domain [hydrothermal vent metagenome]|uniref:Archaeal ATPase, fused to C-terminal DUF234 domain n=1 Tax=hydrothermal vent metagenome TaxID=652676 RepID=A0A3B1DL02_9ZZZZ
MFVGRMNELNLLEEAYRSDKGKLVVIYGRRRVGKSSLVDAFLKEKSGCYAFEAIENVHTDQQIVHFTQFLKSCLDDPALECIRFKSWENVFTYLTDRLIKRSSKKKLVLFFDEFQWMASGRSQLVSLIKYFWDNHWKKNNVMLILCGSIASFMVKKVLSSKALYGRVSLEILLKGLRPDEVVPLFKRKRSKEEILKYLLVFGGIPRYLEEIDLNKSFNQNINHLCFRNNALMLREVERIFYSQFRETKTYLDIVRLLLKGIYTMEEISHTVGIASGGGLKQYLDNLEMAEIIRSYIPYNKKINTKLRKYALGDEFFIFFFQFVEPNLRAIQESRSKKLFETLTEKKLDVWLGFAFERFCIKYAGLLSEAMGFSDEVLAASPYFCKKDRGFQIDLLYTRADKVITLCEIKHQAKPISTAVIPEVKRKCALLKIPRGYSLEMALISLYGPDQSLKDSKYFHHSVMLENIFSLKN